MEMGYMFWFIEAIYMKEIANILMDYGMDYQYENFGSQGEKVTSFSLGLEVSIQNGKIYYSCLGEQEEVEESLEAIKFIVGKISNACIAETT